MKKKLAAAGLAVGVVGLFALAAPNAQATCAPGPSTPDPATDTIIDNPATGGTIYAHGNGEQGDVLAGGYTGTSGDNGYVEVGGTPGESSNISGSSADKDGNGSADVDGSIDVMSPSVCIGVNGTPVEVPPAG